MSSPSVDAARQSTEAPKTRRAGGVYYTPAPIVDYIVEETLGRRLLDSAADEVGSLRVVDPACGSGAFLIAAYQYLVDRHAVQAAAQVGAVSIADRERILLANIYGVDIDPNAVEVTKLSLLLAVLDGLRVDDADVARLAEGLDRNIRCGNSLIDLDLRGAVDGSDDGPLAASAFRWHDAFPAVFDAGGFDAVIGNPPYLGIDAVWGPADPRHAYVKAAYQDIHTDKTDLLYYFLAKAVGVCRRPDGEVAMIVSRSFLEADKAQRLRGWLAAHAVVREIVDFRHAQVFRGAGINTAIVRIGVKRTDEGAVFRRYKPRALPTDYGPDHLRDPSAFVSVAKRLDQLGAEAWVATDSDDTRLLAAIDSVGSPVGDILHIGQGMQTGDNASFTVDADDAELLAVAREHDLLERRVRNSDIDAFWIAPSGPAVLYLEDAQSLDALPTAVRDHLERHRDRLEARSAFRRGDCEWWRYAWPLHREFIREARVFVPYRAADSRFAVDLDASHIGLTDTTVLYSDRQPEDLRYIAAVLNSRVLAYRHRFVAKLAGGGTYEYFHNTVGRLPVPRRAPGDSDHDALVALASAVDDAKTTLAATPVLDQRHAAERRAHEAIEQIEDIVAAMYDLTAADRARIDGLLAD